LAGSPTSAIQEFEDDVGIETVETALREIYPNGSAIKLLSKDTIERTARSFGEGTRGIVSGLSYTVGKDSHAFNFVVTQGKVVFFDPKPGLPLSFGDFSEFHVFFTQLGRGF
jgi:hypothetical protein